MKSMKQKPLTKSIKPPKSRSLVAVAATVLAGGLAVALLAQSSPRPTPPGGSMSATAVPDRVGTQAPSGMRTPGYQGTPGYRSTPGGMNPRETPMRTTPAPATTPMR